MKMKKSMMMSVVVLVLLSLVLAGCVDYKAYDLPKEEQQNTDLVNEIAQVERELAASGDAGAEVPGAGDSLTGAIAAESEEPASAESLEGEEVGVTEGQPAEEVLPGVVVEEVVLPELTEEAETVVAEEDTAEEPSLGQESFDEVLDEEETVITIKENEAVKLRATVTDPDNDQVSYSFSKPLDGNGQWKTNYGDAGEYVVTVTATDSKLTSEKRVKLVVERVNVPPVISSLKNLVVKEGEKVTFTPEVKDPNGDTVTVTVSDPLSEREFAADFSSAGTYEVTVTATDGELTVEEMFILTVQDVNQLPQLNGLTETVKVKEGAVVALQPQVTDADEDEVTLTISDPVGNDGLWETQYTDHGEYFVTVSANDGKDTVSKRVKVIVEDVNMPPKIVDVVAVNR